MTGAPATWLTANEDLLPRTGTALDVACGRGRNALWLAARGLRTRAIDRDAEAVRALEDEANARHLPVETEIVDLERGGVVLGRLRFDLVVVFHYLHRPLFPALVDALAPGGVLVYETFTTAQARRGKPTNPDYLLREAELPQLVQPLEILRDREGDYEGRYVAGIIARRPSR